MSKRTEDGSIFAGMIYEPPLPKRRRGIALADVLAGMLGAAAILGLAYTPEIVTWWLAGMHWR